MISLDVRIGLFLNFLTPRIESSFSYIDSCLLDEAFGMAFEGRVEGYRCPRNHLPSRQLELFARFIYF